MLAHLSNEQLAAISKQVTEEENRRRSITRQQVAKRILNAIYSEYGGKFIFEKDGEVINIFEDFRNREMWIDKNGDIHFEVL